MAAKIFRINYKSDFILTMNSEAGWTIPFCIKFWTSIPMRAYYVGFDGTTYTHCAYDPAEPTKLLVQFDDHHLPIGNLHFQIAYHFTVEDFPNNTEDEVFNATAITTEIDGETYQVMLDFTGETAPGIDFNMPSVGVTSVNGKIGAVTLNAQDVGAQPTIEDLATIRSGAAAGSTAVQPAALQEALAGKQDTIADLSTIRSGAAAGATAVQPAGLQEGLATKQDVIEDLSTIRSGAAAGATAYQKPGTGIPNTDLASAVQTSLVRADEAAVRPYNTQSPDGMGYLVMNKDATFASQVTTANTIYEIRYDYDLNGQTITIPDGCVLEFNGGSINNGIIDGNGCSVFGYRNCFRNCSISSVSNPLESVWFADELQDALMLVEDSTLIVNCGNYTFDKDVKLRQGLIVKGDKYVKINTSHSLYLGYRTEIYGVEIVTTANHAIILDNVWIAESRTNDYLDRHGVDENNVKARVSDCSLACSSVVGTSIFYGILQPTGANMYGITIDHNRFGMAYCGIEFYNAVPYSVQSKPWSTQITISHNTLQLCLNGIYFHRIYDYSNYNNVRAFSGINIIGNSGQQRRILEDGETYSTEYFVRADSISNMQCMENMSWDFETPVYQFCIFGVEHVYIKDTFDVPVSFFGSTDLTTILSANKEPVPSSVHCDSLLSANLPSPTDGSNYTLLDFLGFVAGTDYIVNKNSTFYTQFGFVSHKEGILRKRIVSRYRIAVEVFFFEDSTNPTTIYNGNPTKYVGSFYTRLTDVGATRLVTAIGNIFTPIQLINNRGNAVQAYLPQGSVFYDPTKANVGVIDTNSTRLHVPAFTNNGVRFSTKNNLPTLTANDAGKVAFVTNLAEWIMWDGYTWRGLQGIYPVPSSARPSATDIGRGAIIYDTTINKAIVSNGTDWINMDGTPLLAKSGTTSARPSASDAGAGFTYFDTSLGKMIVSNGTTWVNMDGTALT